MTYRITAPVAGYNGQVVGLRFVDGVAVGEPPEHVHAYLRRHGYRVEPIVEPAPEDPAPTPAVEPPPRGATRDTWIAYVTSDAAGDKRLTPDEAAELKRDELVEHVLGPKWTE